MSHDFLLFFQWKNCFTRLDQTILWKKVKGVVNILQVLIIISLICLQNAITYSVLGQICIESNIVGCQSSVKLGGLVLGSS